MLKERINADLLEAIKGEIEMNRTTLRFLNSVIINKEKEKRYLLVKANPLMKEAELLAKYQLTDEEIIDVVRSEVKKREEAIIEYSKGNRPELANKEKKEAELLKRYLPQQLTKNEIREIAKVAIKESGATSPKDMGKVMGILASQTRGKADGKTVSRIVIELLAVK
ncbi:MAG: GatB/YqeY domain-containing protein [bacterium]